MEFLCLLEEPFKAPLGKKYPQEWKELDPLILDFIKEDLRLDKKKILSVPILVQVFVCISCDRSL